MNKFLQNGEPHDGLDKSLQKITNNGIIKINDIINTKLIDPSTNKIYDGLLPPFNGASTFFVATAGDLSTITTQVTGSMAIVNTPFSTYIWNASWLQIAAYPIFISSAGDVQISGLIDGQYLKYNSGSVKWINSTLQLNDISDVNVGILADKDVLIYNGFSSEFQNRLLTASDLSNMSTVGASLKTVFSYNNGTWVQLLNSLANLSGVLLSTPLTDQILKYNGTNWINDTPQLNDITGVNVGILANNDVLIYNGVSSEFQNRLLMVSDLSNMSTAGASLKTVFSYNNGTWVQLLNSLANLSGVTLSAPSSGQVLTFNGSIWQNQTPAGGGVNIDNTFEIQDDITSTKKLKFQCANITAGQTRTITMADADIDLGSLVSATSTNTLTNKTINDASNIVGANILKIGTNSMNMTGIQPNTGEFLSANSGTACSFKKPGINSFADVKIKNPKNGDSLINQTIYTNYGLSNNTSTLYKYTTTDSLVNDVTTTTINSITNLYDFTIMGGYFIGLSSASLYRCLTSQITATTIPLVALGIDLSQPPTKCTYNHGQNKVFVSDQVQNMVFVGAQNPLTASICFSNDFGSSWSVPTSAHADFPTSVSNYNIWNGVQWSNYYGLFYAVLSQPLPRVFTSETGAIWVRSTLHDFFIPTTANVAGSCSIDNVTGRIVISSGNRTFYSSNNIAWFENVTTTGINGIVYSPRNSAFYAGTSPGSVLKKSLDFGVTWTNLVATGGNGYYFRFLEATNDIILLNYANTEYVLNTANDTLGANITASHGGTFFRNQVLFSLQENNIVNQPKTLNLFSPYSFSLTNLTSGNPTLSANFLASTSYVTSVAITVFTTTMVQAGLFNISYALNFMADGPASVECYTRIVSNGLGISPQLRRQNSSASDYYSVTDSYMTQLAIGDVVEVQVRAIRATTGVPAFILYGNDQLNGLGSRMTFTKIAN